MSAERNGGVEEQELNASLDGRLPPDRAAVVASYLAAHPEEQARLQRYAEIQQQLRTTFEAHSDEPIPRRLRTAHLFAERRRRQYWQAGAVAAALALLLVGLTGGWAARNAGIGLPSASRTAQAATEREITADALAAHRLFSVEVKHPVEVDAAQQAHLVQWLSKRLGRPLVVPDLTSAGFQLMGGRLLPSENGPAAQFMYQHGDIRLTLYERNDTTGDTAFRYSDTNGIGVFYWSDQDFGYALTAKADRQELLKIAELVYRQLSSDAPKDKRTVPLPGKAS